MKRIAWLSLAAVLALGGCPGGSVDVPSAVSILVPGVYQGTVTYIWTFSDPNADVPEPVTLNATVEILEGGQLYINDRPYFQGARFGNTDETETLTIDAVTEDPTTKTVTIAGTGIGTDDQGTYQTTQTITLVQISDTELEFSVEQNIETDPPYQLSGTGTLSR